MSDSTERTPTLKLGVRGLFGLLAIGLAVLAGWLIVGPLGTKTIAAPECAGAPSECVVTITYVPDSSIVIFVLALAALFFLIAISGRLWTLKYGDTELSPEVKPTSEAEAKKRQDAGEAEQVISKSGQDLYSRLDQEVVHALDARWRYWYDMSVASKITQVKRATGKGNHAWFIEANTPEGNKIWVRVTKGGRSGGMRAIRH